MIGRGRRRGEDGLKSQIENAREERFRRVAEGGGGIESQIENAGEDGMGKNVEVGAWIEIAD